jgi:HD-GYP domain-containing protein (c-di-GMP phosphodiesterase class II)
MLKESAAAGLKKAGIFFVYTDEGEGLVNAVYDQKNTAELLKIMKYFYLSGGENAEILKRYDKKDIRRFLSAANETGNKIAYGHVFRYFSEKMVVSLNENVKHVYDFFDYRDMEKYPDYHAINTACITGVIAHNLGFKDAEKADSIIGALLCDSKMNLYKFVNESRKLDGQEKEEMRQHVALGFDTARKIYGIPARSALITAQHHERNDGSGYPKGLKGNTVNILSAIAGIADVYDSMTSRRPFREAFTPYEAWLYITSNSGHVFEKTASDEFGRSIPAFFPGDIVELSGGEKAEVVKNQYGRPLEPSIKLIEKTGKSAIISCDRKINKIVKTTGSIRQKER